MKTAGILLTLAALLILLPEPAAADGSVFAPWRNEMYEYSQLAFIHHDAASARETLHVIPLFSGDAREFAWIVPLPAPPEIVASDIHLFNDAERFSQPVYRHRDEGFKCDDRDYLVGAPGQDEVEIISDQVVGIYQTLVVTANDAAALADSLQGWGYLPPDGDEDAESVLQYYVAKDWYFAVMRVDTTAFAEQFPYQQDSYDGAIQPMAFAFDSPEIVYPLRISRLSAAPVSRVLLYVVADRRTTFAGATTRFADRITSDELAGMPGSYPHLANELAAGDFLTKLARNFTPAEMTEDLVLEPAASNDAYRELRISGVPLTFLGVWGAPTLGYLVWRLGRGRGEARRRAAGRRRRPRPRPPRRG